jgi:hypothetical protein
MEYFRYSDLEGMAVSAAGKFRISADRIHQLLDQVAGHAHYLDDAQRTLSTVIEAPDNNPEKLAVNNAAGLRDRALDDLFESIEKAAEEIEDHLRVCNDSLVQLENIRNLLR